MQDKEAGGIVALSDEVVPLIHLAELELFQQFVADRAFKVAEGKVPHKAVRDDLLVVWLLVSVDLGKGLIDDFLIVVLDCSKFAQFPSLLIVTLLGRPFATLQLEVAKRTQQTHLLTYQIFHFDY